MTRMGIAEYTKRCIGHACSKNPLRAVALCGLAQMLSCNATGPAQAPRVLIAPPRPSEQRPSQAVANPRKAPRVVLLSIDGLHPRFVQHPDTYGLAIPNMRALIANGSVARSMKTVFPSLTYPAHVTMVTGALPSEHGIENNFVLDPDGDNKDGWHWYADRIRVPTVWDKATAAGLSVASVYFPVTLGARIRWNVPQFWRAENKEDARLLSLLIDAPLRDELQSEGLALPGEHTTDHARAQIAAYLLREKDPDLLLAYFEDLDTASHKHGPQSEQALRTLEAIDRELGVLRSATEPHGEARDTLWIVVSDHGFASASKRVRIGYALQRAGLLGDVKKKIPSRVTLARSNGMCALYVRRDDDTETHLKLETLLRELARDPKSGIGRVYTRDELIARHAYPGADFAVEGAPGYMFVKSTEAPLVSPSEELGAHGYDPEREDMRATFILSGAGAPKGQDLGDMDIRQVAPTVLRGLGLQ
jgi:predicted AlkP superfamily pyrophosphatase or phosphodiesterase